MKVYKVDEGLFFALEKGRVPAFLSEYHQPL